MQSEQTTKEATILDLSVQLMAMANGLQVTLDKRFRRKPTDRELCTPEAPQPDNSLDVYISVLDEISQNLIHALDHYYSLDVYINSEVLPKIN